MVHLLLALALPHHRRCSFTYYTTTIINAVAALAYLTMALGNTEYENPNGYRGFLWIRYVDWVITVPLLVIDLGVLAGAHWVDIYFTVFAAIAMIAAGFAGAVSTGTNATWPLFTFGFVAFAPVALNLLTSFRTSAYRHHVSCAWPRPLVLAAVAYLSCPGHSACSLTFLLSAPHQPSLYPAPLQIEIGKLYDVLGFGSVLLWTVYGIVWGCAEGGYKMTPDQEVIVYAVLDITAKCVFGFVLLFSREAIARYGTFLGGINTGITYDFPIPSTVTASSANSYAVATSGKTVVYGEHRDLALAQLRAATNTQPSSAAAEHAPLVVGVEYGAKSVSH